MEHRQDTWTSRVDDRPETCIEVRTSRRSYSVIGPGRVTWERGEKVVSIEAKATGRAAGTSSR